MSSLLLGNVALTENFVFCSLLLCLHFCPVHAFVLPFLFLFAPPPPHPRSSLVGHAPSPHLPAVSTVGPHRETVSAAVRQTADSALRSEASVLSKARKKNYLPKSVHGGKRGINPLRMRVSRSNALVKPIGTNVQLLGFCSIDFSYCLVLPGENKVEQSSGWNALLLAVDLGLFSPLVRLKSVPQRWSHI